MSVSCQDRIQEITQLLQANRYSVDPVAVAEAIVGRMVSRDTPDMTRPSGGPLAPAAEPRLRGLIRVGRLVSPPVSSQTRLGA